MVLVFTPTVLCSIPEIKRVANVRIKYNAREDENKKEFSIMVKQKAPNRFRDNSIRHVCSNPKTINSR